MMGDLPAQVAEAGLLFQRTGVQNDPESFRMIMAWGHAQIDAAYPEDPIRAPLNVVRRKLAHIEWDRVIRTAGRELRGSIANTMVKELEFAIERRKEDILARDRKARRQEAVTYDQRRRIEEHDVISQIDLRREKELLQFNHELQQQAEDAASRRRSEELVVATQQEVIRLSDYGRRHERH